MQQFLESWHQAAQTTLGLFWMALWAFGLGYLISSMIQVFVTRQRMRRTMKDAGPRSVGLGTFFGFISSSCSFAALATSRALFAKGAGLIPALAFLLASTNLVVELGIVISIFLGWQFVVGEYVGGIVLILLMWMLVRLTLPTGLAESARRHAQRATGDEGESEVPDWKRLIRSREGWRRVAGRYLMEWHMVWKDVTIGFTVAGIIATFVPRSFFQSLFIGAGQDDPTFGEVLAQTVVGPVAAFFTFIGSMGNIPLAAVLYENGVSFAGVMAFIFSDLVVLPVLRIQAQYYGWKMALYILGVFLLILVASSLLLHYAFAAFDILPAPDVARAITQRDFFKVDYTLALNSAFLAMSAVFLVWRWKAGALPRRAKGGTERALFFFACIAMAWLIGGLFAA